MWEKIQSKPAEGDKKRADAITEGQVDNPHPSWTLFLRLLLIASAFEAIIIIIIAIIDNPHQY